MQATYAHYAFVVIHPFADGNGRVSRALASIYLYRSNRIPLLVPADTTNEYLDALEEGDGGNYQPFVEFVLERAMETMQLVEAALGPDPAALIPRIGNLLRAHGGMTHAQMDNFAIQIVRHIEELLRTEIAGLSLPEGVLVNFGSAQSNTSASLAG